MKIIALNLPRNLIEEDLKNLFTNYGSIKSCNIVMDENTGKSKGFGFVEMPIVNEAEEAIEKLHNTKISNKKIRVKRAK